MAGKLGGTQAEIHSAKQKEPCHKGKRVMLEKEGRLCWVKSKPYVNKIRGSQIIQTLLVNSTKKGEKLECSVLVVPINLSDVCQRPCHHSKVGDCFNVFRFHILNSHMQF